jgi:cytochrome c oxidase subunit 3
MSVDIAESHADGPAGQWKTSGAPLAIVSGLLFLLPAAGECYFVYNLTQLALGFAGLGLVLLIFGISIWLSEGLSQKVEVPGLAAFGISFFLVVEFFIFMALFASFWMMHLFADVWPPAGTPDMPYGLSLIMLAIMVVAAVLVFVAGGRFRSGDLAGFKGVLAAVVVLGLVFLGVRGYEYSVLLGLGFNSGSNPYSTCYYAITAFHALNVLVGTGAFAAMLLAASSGRTNSVFVTCVSIYWMFLTVATIFVVSQVYFWD